MGRARIQQLALEYGETGTEDVIGRIGALNTLLSICAELIGVDCMLLHETEIAAQYRTPVERTLIEAVRSAIVRGCEPLGSAYCSLRSPGERRGAGQTFTPRSIVDAMLRWTEERRSDFARVVDPGAGSGRYILTALQRMPHATGVAVELDPVVALLLRANAHVLRLNHRLEIRTCDYRDLCLDEIDGRTLFIGNPPYVRHHQIDPVRKAWYSDRLKKLGHASSQLAGLHLHFFLKTIELAKPGDIGCFITAAEWLDVNYGRSLRELMTAELGGRAIFLLPYDVPVFDDALVSACITCFEPGAGSDAIEFKKIDALGPCDHLGKGRPISREIAEASPRWSALFSSRVPEGQDGAVALGSLFKVMRGQVTGSNGIWVTRDNPFELPERYLIPAITNASDIIREPTRCIEDLSRLRRVIDLPACVEELNGAERQSVEAFLNWARSQGADQSYIARHRTPWWRVNLKDPPPIVMTYMGRRPPVFALNTAGARLINIAHGLYPRTPLSQEMLEKYVAWLNCNVHQDSGRVYAGGLTKFEPSEVMRLQVPSLENMAVQEFERP